MQLISTCTTMHAYVWHSSPQPVATTIAAKLHELIPALQISNAAVMNTKSHLVYMMEEVILPSSSSYGDNECFDADSYALYTLGITRSALKL